MAKGGKDTGPSKKTEMKKKEKIIDDKTFGLKNKNKSVKVQKYVALYLYSFTRMVNTVKAQVLGTNAKVS